MTKLVSCPKKTVQQSVPLRYSIAVTPDSIVEVFTTHMAGDTGSALVFQVKPRSVVKGSHTGLDTNSSISTLLITADHF